MKSLLFTLCLSLVTLIAYGQSNSSAVSQQGSTNEAVVIQVGLENRSEINHRRGQNMATVQQSGARNESFVTSKTPNGNLTNEVDIDQIGDDNRSRARQLADDNFIKAFVRGNNNDTRVRQRRSGNRSNLALRGDGNIADIYQEGFDNRSVVRLGLKPNTADLNEATIAQVGDNNHFRLEVMGDQNTINLTATGNSNRGEWGMSNEAGAIFSNTNTLDILQDGDYNLTSGYVEGSGNDIDINQTGYDNQVGTSWTASDGVHIIGNSNSVSITQSGMGNRSLNTQIGNGNTINVNQQEL